MPIKQIKLTLQATPTTATDVNVSISVDGTVRFNQSVPAVGPSQQGVLDPSEVIEFNLEVATATLGVTTEDHAFSITATNGKAKIETIAANFSLGFDPVANAVTAGDANTFQACNIVSQPEWNGQALLERYNIAYNRGPEQVTGPGELLILPGETVTFTSSVANFNDSLPLGGYIVFDSQPSSLAPGATGTFQVSIPSIDPDYPLPRTFGWQVINQTTQDSDFVATSGNVEFTTANSAFSISTTNAASAGIFSVRLLGLVTGNIVGQSDSVSIT